MDTEGKQSAPPAPLGVQAPPGAVRPLRPPLKLPTGAKLVQAPPRPPVPTATRPSVPCIRKSGGESPNALRVPGAGSLARPAVTLATNTTESVPVAAPALHAKLPTALNPPKPRLVVPRLNSLTKGASLPRPGSIHLGRRSSGGSSLASPMSSTSGNRPIARSAADILHPQSPSNSGAVADPFPSHTFPPARTPASPSSVSGSVVARSQSSTHGKLQVKAPVPVRAQSGTEHSTPSTAHGDTGANSNQDADGGGMLRAGRAASVPGVRPNTNLGKEAPVPAPHAGFTQSDSKKQANTILPKPGTSPAPVTAAESSPIAAEASASTVASDAVPPANDTHAQEPVAVAGTMQTQADGSLSCSVQPGSQAGWGDVQESTGTAQMHEPSTSEVHEANTSTWGAHVGGSGLEEPRVAASAGLQSPAQGDAGTGAFDWGGTEEGNAQPDTATSASQPAHEASNQHNFAHLVPEVAPAAVHRSTHSQATTHSFFDDLAAPSTPTEGSGAHAQAPDSHGSGGWGQQEAHALNHAPAAPAADVQSSWAPSGQDTSDYTAASSASAAAAVVDHTAGSGSFFDQWQQQDSSGGGGGAAAVVAGHTPGPTDPGYANASTADVHGSSALSQHYTSEVASAFEHSSSAQGGIQEQQQYTQSGDYAQQPHYMQQQASTEYQRSVDQYGANEGSYFDSLAHNDTTQQGEPYWYEEWGCWVSACSQYYYDDASASWLAIPQQDAGDAASYGVAAEATSSGVGVGASASPGSLHMQPDEGNKGITNHLQPLELPQSSVQAPGSCETGKISPCSAHVDPNEAHCEAGQPQDAISHIHSQSMGLQSPTALQQYSHEQQTAGKLGSPPAHGTNVQQPRQWQPGGAAAHADGHSHLQQPYMGYIQQQQQQQPFQPSVPASNTAFQPHQHSSSTILPQPPQSGQYGAAPTDTRAASRMTAQYAPAAPATQQPSSEAPRSVKAAMYMNAGRPPRPFLTFGVGGRCCLCKLPDPYTSYASNLSQTQSVSVIITDVTSLTKAMHAPLALDLPGGKKSGGKSSRPSSHRAKDDAALAVFRDWPGPMAVSTPSGKTIAAAVEVRSRVATARGRSAQALIWKLLGAMAKHKGAVVDTAVRGAQPEAEIAQLLAADLDNMGSGSSSAEAAANMINSWVAHDTSAATVRQIEDLIVSGKRPDALEAAKQARLWPLAIMIAQFIGAEVYRDAVRAMLDAGLQQGSVLHMFSLLATSSHDQVASSLQDPAATGAAAAFAPDTALTQPSGPPMYQAGATLAPNAAAFTPSRPGVVHTSLGGPVNHLNGLKGQPLGTHNNNNNRGADPAPAPLTWSPSTDTWPRTLIMMAANRTPGDSSALTGFGDHLWTLGKPHPRAYAHVCYILAGRPVDHVPDSDSTFAAPGVDHAACMGSCCTVDALQCVELLAWCQAQCQSIPMYSLAPRYLQYAGQLAEAGLIADAVAYTNAAMQLLGKAKADRTAAPSFNVDAVLAAATDWHTRLKAHGAATGASHVRSSQSVVSRFGNFLDRTVMNMLGAADVNPNPINTSPGLSKSGSAASLASTRAAPPLHPGRGGSWGGNEMRRGVTVPDMASATAGAPHTAKPLQPLHMHSASNASSPRARSASCAPSAAAVSQSASPHSVQNTSMSPPVPGPPGLAGGPQGRALGSGATSRNVSSWSGGPGSSEGDQQHSAPIIGHRRQLSESALGGGSPNAQGGHSRTGSEVRPSPSKSWLGGFAARILPGSGSKENVADSVGKPPVAPAYPPAQQSHAYSGLGPPPSFGAWGDVGAPQTGPQIPPSHTQAPSWGAQPAQANNSSGQQWPAHQPGRTATPGYATGASMSHHAPQTNASGSFFSQSAPTAASYMQPAVPSIDAIRPQYPMYRSNNGQEDQQYRKWNVGEPPAGPHT